MWMWNIENSMKFMKQTREDFYSDDWMLTIKPIYYTTKHISFNEVYTKFFYYWKLIAEIKIINNSSTSLRWNMRRILDKLQVNYLLYKTDVTQAINNIYVIPKEIIIEENKLAGVSFEDISFKDITVIKFLESSFKDIGFLKWNFKWKKNIKRKVPYLMTEDKKDIYYFINEKFEKVVEQEYKEIEKNYFLSNKNFKEWFFTFNPENHAIEVPKDYFFHSTPFQNLFNFFEKQLIDKWIENYEILLGNNRIWTNEMSKSDLICIELHFLILTDGQINRKLADELMKTYLKTDWVVNQSVWDEYTISLLVDKSWAFFSFEKRYIQRFTSLTYLINEYYEFKEWNDTYLIKYSHNKQNFEIVDKLYLHKYYNENSIYLENWWNQTNASCIAYLNEEWELKFSSNLFNNWEIITLERYEVDYLKKYFQQIIISNTWKELLFISLDEVHYFVLEHWNFNKYIIPVDNAPKLFNKYIIPLDIAPKLLNFYYIDAKSPYEKFDCNSETQLHISCFKKWIWWDKIDDKRMIDSKFFKLKETEQIEWKTCDTRWRFIHWLKWLSFLKEYNFTLNNYPTSNFKNNIKDFMKETTNIFNKWIYEKEHNSLINQQDEFENILDKSIPINHINWFRLTNWKMDFLYETGDR